MAMGTAERGRGRGRGRRPMAEINVTPLVDVMLVLLIIFMVTAPMMTAGVPVNLPDSRARALPQPTKPVEVTVDARGRVFIGQSDVTNRLPEQLARIAATSTGERPPVTLTADRALEYGRVVRVMGELNRAGFDQVALVTKGGVGN